MNCWTLTEAEAWCNEQFPDYKWNMGLRCDKDAMTIFCRRAAGSPLYVWKEIDGIVYSRVSDATWRRFFEITCGEMVLELHEYIDKFQERNLGPAHRPHGRPS